MRVSKAVMSRIVQYIISISIVALFIFVIMRQPPVHNVAPEYDKAVLQYDPIENVPNPFRMFMWLNGEWQFRIEGEKKTHPVAVPHSWNNIPGLENYYGKAYYSVEFDLPEDWEPGDTIIHFGAVSGKVSVSMNGTPVPSGVNRMFPFEVNVGCCVTFDKKNVLELEIDGSEFDLSGDDEKQYMGILREVRAEQHRSLLFRDVSVETINVESATATLNVSVILDIPSMEKVHLVGEIDRPLGAPVTFDTVVLPSGEHSIVVDFAVDVGDVRLWSPETPSMYKVSLVGIHESGMADGISRPFGIRNVEFVDGSLLINGEAVVLRGVVYRQQYGDGWGPIVSEKQLLEDLAYIKKAGFNAVRLTGPAHPSFLDMCDISGILVFDELSLESESFSGEKLVTQLERFVMSDRLHPSVIARGFNIQENQISEYFVQAVSGADPSRPVYVLNRNSEILESAGRGLNAVQLPTERPGKLQTMFSRVARATGKNRSGTFIVASAGSSGSPFRPKKVGLPGSELNQLYIIGLMDDLVDQSALAAGWFLNSFSDYYSSTILPNGSSLLHENGIMTLERDPKFAFEHLAGLADSAPEISWTRFPFVLSKIELAVLLVLLVIWGGVWIGAGGILPVLLEPDLVWPADGSWKSIFSGLLLFAFPMLLAASLCASFAVSPSFDYATTGTLDVSRHVIDYILTFMNGAASRTIFFFIIQAAGLVLASLVASLFVGGEPFTVFEVFSRTLSLRMLYLLIPFLPVPAVVVIGGVLIWEGLLQAGALSRGFALGPIASVFLVTFSHIFAIIFTLLIFIHRFGHIGNLFIR